MVSDFRELTVWQEAMALAEQVYGLSDAFPAQERYGLTAQLRRSVVSVPSCIAEGNARYSTRDYLRFLSMAAGSLAEARTQILLAVRLKFAASPAVDPVILQLDSVAKLLRALRKSLQSRISEDAPPFPIPHSPFPASP